MKSVLVFLLFVASVAFAGEGGAVEVDTTVPAPTINWNCASEIDDEFKPAECK